MNFFTQLAVLIIVLLILAILIKSNQTLEKIYMEEEEEKDITIELPKVRFSEIKIPKLKFAAAKGEPEEREAEIMEEMREKGSVKPPQVERSGATIPMTLPSGWSVAILDDYGRMTDTRKISGFPFTIGRVEDNDLVLDDLSVSSHHAALEQENGKVEIVDKGSLNKIYVRGEFVTRAELTDRMEIGLGNIRLRFEKEGRI